MNSIVLFITAIALLIAMFGGWLLQRQSRNAGIVDALWAFGLGISAVVYAWTGPGDPTSRLLVGLIAGIWFTRLGAHVLNRVLHEAEDGRYQAIRRRYGQRINAFHALFFFVQALAAWLFALPMWIIAHNPGLSPLWPVAVILVVVAFCGESLADRQLDTFRNNPANRGKTCRDGLWRYSRHPNYFFEWLHWFAYPLLAWGAPFGSWVWLAPIAMFLFLYFITGIPYTEQQALRSRGDDYRDYQRTTSAFIPWRVKS